MPCVMCVMYNLGGHFVYKITGDESHVKEHQ